DFYETFDGDAEVVASVTGVTLTSRPMGRGEGRVPLAGVPYHSIEGYIAKLVESGYKVAIADQVSEPGKGLVEREVTRVVSKGTVIEPGMLDDKRNNYLMAVSFNGRGTVAGVAYCDITTGEFATTQVTANGDGATVAVEALMGEELSRLRPSELIHVDWQPTQSSLHGLIANLGPLLSTVEPWQTEVETATDALKRHFRVSSLDGFGLQNKPQAVRAAAAILAYLKAMQPT
ncbi:MAG: DNA mismatch repair protein MutS, partial [Caldilineaceae bacterium]|nr:DNA mismatch repair protein MutS [Caldilineaceae bacterium]